MRDARIAVTPPPPVAGMAPIAASTPARDYIAGLGTEEFDPDNFESLTAIEALVEKKRST